MPPEGVSVRAARGRPRKVVTDARQRRDAPLERSAVPANKPLPTVLDDTPSVDPLQTHCSVELRDAQNTDYEITQMKKLLDANPRSKPTPKQISQYGPKFKSLWTKWGDLIGSVMTSYT